MKYSDGLVLCLSGCLKQNRLSPLSDVKSVVMKSASSSANLQGLLQIEKVAPAFERLLWGTLFLKQENLLLFAISMNVCMHWDCSLREREVLPEMNIENC